MALKCYRLDCKIAGCCQNQSDPRYMHGICCKDFKIPFPPVADVEIVGPPVPPLPKNLRGYYLTWRRIHRRNWLSAACSVADKLWLTATRYTGVSWREVGVRHGLPDHQWLGEVVRQAVQWYCNDEGEAFPYRDRGQKIRGRRG